jgi:hypothetical protein
MKTKGHYYGIKAVQSLQPGQLRGHVQIAAVESTPSGDDGVRQ